MTVNAAKLKILGMISLVLLNLSMFGLVRQPVLKMAFGILGTASITIFAFLITEGYRKTGNLNKYILRTLVFAVLSAFPYHAIMKLVYADKADITGYFSAGLTAFICLGAIATYDKIQEKKLRYVFVFFVCVVSYLINFYWAPFAFILVFIIHIYRENFGKMAYYICSLFLAFFIVGIVFKLMGGYEGQQELDMMIYQSGCVLPLPLIAKYNGQEGIRLKWIVPLFYLLMLFAFMFLLVPKQTALLPLLF